MIKQNANFAGVDWRAAAPDEPVVQSYIRWSTFPGVSHGVAHGEFTKFPWWAAYQCAIEALGCGRPTADRAGFTLPPGARPSVPARADEAAAAAGARGRRRAARARAGADEPVRHERRDPRPAAARAERGFRARGARHGAPAARRRAARAGRGEANERAELARRALRTRGGASGAAAAARRGALAPALAQVRAHPGQGGPRLRESRERAPAARARARARSLVTARSSRDHPRAARRAE